MTSFIKVLYLEKTFIFTGLLVEANPDSYSRLLGARRKVFSVGQCLSTKTRPEVVDFDAAGIFGGIMRDGRNIFGIFKSFSTFF